MVGHEDEFKDELDDHFTLEEVLAMEMFDRKLIARTDETSLEILEALSKDPRAQVRMEVAANFSTPSRILEKLISDSDHDVVTEASRNSNLTSEQVAIIATNEDPSVRESAANHPSVSVATLASLALDPDYYVRLAVARNPRTPLGLPGLSSEDLKNLEEALGRDPMEGEDPVTWVHPLDG